MPSRTRFLAVTLLYSSFLFLPISQAAPPKVHAIRPGIRTLLKVEKEYVAQLDKDDSLLSKGMKADIYLQTGDKLVGAEITEIQLGKPKHALKGLSVNPAKGAKRKLTPNSILHIATDDRVFDVVQDQDAKAFVLLDLARRDELASKRLAKTGHSLWKDPTDEQRKKAIEDSKDFFGQVREKFGGHEFQMHETNFFLFLTDMPNEQISGYIANLDEMYKQLCVAFGILPDRNIWLGKCPVIAFVDREMFYAFERTMMNNNAPERAQGLYHGRSDGSVVVSAYRGDDPTYFAVVLVHETAHGFVHRLRSNVHIHSWLNEGIADWIAGVTVPASNAVSRRQSDAIVQLRTTRALGGFFNPQKQLTATEYGTASSLIDFMLHTDSNLFRAFLMAIKDGYSPEDALRSTYNVDFDTLAKSYGASIGVPDLAP